MFVWSTLALNQSAFVVLPEQSSSSPLASPSNHHEQTLPESVAVGVGGAEFERIIRSISAVGAATYHWNIETDEIIWHGDVGQVFNNIDPAKFANGRSYASLLDPDNFTSRFETVMRNGHTDEGKGVAFSIEYAIKPFGREQDRSIWVEDSGRWYAGPKGQPREVFGIVRQSDDRHKQDQHLQFMSNCDPLTGMLNRGRLAEALGETIALAKTEGHTSSFLIVSVSNLAMVNDTYGFDMADDVIAKIGKRLREVVRTGDVIGRYSGSKFGIIMSRANRDEITTAAERFLTIARQQVIETEMGPVWAMLSIGAVHFPNKNEDANNIMAHAEEALTEAARLPTDSFVIYQPSADLISERKLNSRCAVEIVHSLKENQFTLAYQPVVDAVTKEVAFHEALLRMKTDNGEFIAAGHLIPISEKLGLVRLIDQLVANKVVTALRQFPEAKIAMNISGVTANDPRWFNQLTEVLEENRDVTDRLTVELTETVVLEDIDQIVAFIKKLHNLGCKVAIDDFGAGFTSFKNLQVLNVDKVKIDGSFCEDLANNQDNQFFVRTLIELSKKFDLEIVAEWVENEADAVLLSSWGVHFLQGRLYGMAESQCPWGEAPVDQEAICVVPSEILLKDSESVQVSNDEAESPEETELHDEKETNEVASITMVQDPVSRPFEAIIPESMPVIETPETDVHVEIENAPTSNLDQPAFDATDGLAMLAKSETGESDSGQPDPIEAELLKLRQTIEKLNTPQDTV